MSTNEDSDVNTRGFDYLKLRREVLAKEIDYRREKRWRIFSWTSSILLAALGGVLALTGKGFHFPLLPHRALSAAAALFVSLYAFLWITMNRKEEKSLRVIMEKYDDDLGIGPVEKDQPFPLGYKDEYVSDYCIYPCSNLFCGAIK
jgi:hypothetical protein